MEVKYVTFWPFSINLIAYDSPLRLSLASLATPKFPDPISLITSQRSIVETASFKIYEQTILQVPCNSCLDLSVLFYCYHCYYLFGWRIFILNMAPKAIKVGKRLLGFGSSLQLARPNALRNRAWDWDGAEENDKNGSLHTWRPSIRQNWQQSKTSWPDVEADLHIHSRRTKMDNPTSMYNVFSSFSRSTRVEYFKRHEREYFNFYTLGRYSSSFVSYMNDEEK